MYEQEGKEEKLQFWNWNTKSFQNDALCSSYNDDDNNKESKEEKYKNVKS